MHGAKENLKGKKERCKTPSINILREIKEDSAHKKEHDVFKQGQLERRKSSGKFKTQDLK